MKNWKLRPRSDWKFKSWELAIIAYAIVTIILAIIGYYVEAVALYSTLSSFILVVIMCIVSIIKVKEMKEKK